MAAPYGTGRDRLLAAAREVFAGRGYRGATTRDIAAAAGVTEPMVFRHFGSKAALFEEAAVAPLVAFMDEYAAQWRDRDRLETTPVQQARDFIGRLSDLLVENRSLLLAILTAGEFDTELAAVSDQLRDAVGRLAATFHDVVRTELAERGLVTPDPEAFSRVCMGLVLAVSLHQDWLSLEGDPAQARRRLVDEAARALVSGLDGRTG